MNVSPHHQRPAKYPWPGGSPAGVAVVLVLALVVIVGFILISGVANDDDEVTPTGWRSGSGDIGVAVSQPPSGVRSAPPESGIRAWQGDNCSVSEQRCIGCGRETAVGTSLFASRHIRKDPKTGDTTWVCAACLDDGVLASADFGDAFLRGAELGDIAR